MSFPNGFGSGFGYGFLSESGVSDDVPPAQQAIRSMTGSVSYPGPPAGSAFSPSLISGMLAWYRADNPAIVISTGVSTWPDQSGSGDSNRDAVQATGSRQPALTTSDAAYNNQATLSFIKANDQGLVSGTWSVAPAQPCTIVVVGNDDGTVSNQAYVGDSDATFANLIDTNDPSTGPGLYAGVALTAGLANSNAVRAIVGVFNGASSVIYVNALTALATGDAGATAAVGITMGVVNSGLSGALNGKIAEVIVYSGALSAAQVAQLLTYAGSRYGITIGA